MHTVEPSWSRVLSRISGAMASVIFPGDCRICESLLTTASRLPICHDCLASFMQNPLEICDVCGVPWSVPGESDEEFAICPECREQKYEHIETLGKWFADRLLDMVRGDEKRLWGDMVVPVPLHRQRTKERTRIQSGGTVCEAAGEALGDPVPAGAVDAHAAASRETSDGL
jgi:predicted amidophosphoribosyltransferase